MLLMYSFDRRMSSTRTTPRYCWQSAKSIASFFICRVSVTSAQTIAFVGTAALSSVIIPDGMSMLTTRAGDWLMYFTSEAKPPSSGLLSPEPNNPSTISVCSVSLGGSKLFDTSVKRCIRPSLMSRSRFLAHSSDR